jgi:hypothetical protein
MTRYTRRPNTTHTEPADLSLRDYFAALAMQSVISAHGVLTDSLEAADLAYEMSDAMLAAREKPAK